MKKILVLGSSGLVGSRFTDLYHKEKLTITPKSEELDITDEKKVESFFERNNEEFHSIINFAAYTDVDGAQTQKGDKKGLAWQVNVNGAKNIAEAAKRYNKFLIHISTDFIFPGTVKYPGPYSEDAKLPEKPDEISWYGWTKLVAERKVKKKGGEFTIVRISYPYRAHFPPKIDFARAILTLFDEGELYPMFADQKLSPTFIDEACKALYIILEEKIKGILHVASRDLASPYEFASYLLDTARGVKGVVKKASMREFLKAPGRTPRPRLGGLDTKKTQKRLNTQFRSWKKSVDELVRQIKGK